MADDVQRLLLQIDASATLLRQEVAKARTDIDGFADRAERKLGGIQGAFDRLGKGAGLAVRALGGLSAGLLSVGSAAALAVNSTREMQRLTAQLEVATGSTAAASAAFKQLTDFAEKTPFTLAQVTEAYIRLRNLGIDPTEDRLRSFGNTSAAMGKDLMQFIEAVADAATGEFERLKEFGIRASKERDKVRFTFQGVTEEVNFNAEAITNYLEKIGQTKFGDAMAKQAATIDGKLSNLQDATASLGRALGGLGISKATISSVELLTRAMNVAANVAEKLGKAFTPLSWREPLEAARRDYVEAINDRIEAERKLRQGGVINRLTGGNTFSVNQARREEAAAFARYNQLWNQAQTESQKAAKAGKRSTRTGGTSRASDFVDPSMRAGWALGMADSAEMQLQNEALRGIAQTMKELAQYDFELDLIDRQQIELAQDYTRTLTEGLAQAVIYGRNFGDVLKGLAQQILSSGLINILSGGKFGTSFGDSLGALGSIFGGFRAEGGPVSLGKAYVVGERGPELFIPKASGFINPNTGGGGNQGGGTSDVRVTVEPSPLFITTVAQATQAASADAMRRANRPRMMASPGA